jgi:hypothetical protein
LQYVWLGMQIATHVLAWHLWPSGQALPHIAQFWSSLCV